MGIDIADQASSLARDEKKATDTENDGIQLSAQRSPSLGVLDSIHKTDGTHTDVGLELFQKSLQYDQEQLAADVGKVRRKLDFLVLPMMMVTYMLSFLDKQTLNYANAYGLQEDTHMTGDQYSWVASALYFGWLLGSYPSNLALQRFPIGKFVGGMTLIWGAVCMLQAAAFSFSGLFAVRFFLGMVESCVSPGWLLLSSTLWTREEMPLRSSFWLAMNGMAQVIGALLSYGLGNVTNLAVPNWKLIYIVIGALTLLWAIVLILWVPDGPHNGRMFSEYERVVAVWRIRNNRTGVQNPTFLQHQLNEASIDPKSYILLLMAAAYGILNGCVTNFASELIKGFGFTGLQANLLQTPGGAFQIFTNIGFGFLATLPNMLGVSNFLACIPGTAGLIGMLLIPNSQRWALAACSWLQGSLGPCIVLNWTLPSMNIAGHTKRTTVMGLYFAFYCAGNISSPHLFIPSEAPRYKTAIKGLVGTYCVAMFLQLVYTAWCYVNNRGRDKQHQEEGSREQQVVGHLEGFEDFTDKENKHFRYRI